MGTNQLIVKKPDTVFLAENFTFPEITTPEEQQMAEDMLVRGKRLYKEIKTHYDGLIRPIQTALDVKKCERDEHLEAIEAKLNIIKTRVTTYLTIVEAKRQEEVNKQNAKLLEKAKQETKQEVKALIKAGKVDEALAVKPAPVEFRYAEAAATGDGVERREVLDFEIINLKLVPETYFKPRELDRAKIKNAGREGKEIPGVKFFKKTTLAIRA